MTTEETIGSTGRQSRRTPSAVVVIVAAVAVAVVVDLAIYAVGRATGGGFRFTTPAGPTQVDAATVAGFAAVPLLVGLVLAALLARRWPRVLTVALVVAPTLALVTVPLLTLPADFDGISTVALSLCHVTLVPVSVAALLALRRPTTVA